MRLSEIESSKMKSDRQVKELIATRKTESCVRYYDDVISKEWCNKVIDLFEAEKIPISSKFGFNEGNNPRKSFTELDIEGKDKWKDVKETFIKVCRQNFQNFIKDVNIERHHLPVIVDLENIRIKKYEANGKDVFKDHVDVIRSQGPSAKRFLVFILYLNDCKGGETYIPRYNISSQPKQGRLLMFPPFWTHPHMGKKVQKGNKYIMMSYLRMK